MRLRFQEACRNGYRREPYNARNTQYLVSCVNLRCTQDGLKDFNPLDQPMTDAYLTTTLSETKAWPFPQIFRGKKVTLLVYEDAIYTVDESAWTATAVTTYDIDDLTGGTLLSLATGGHDWHFADFWDSWWLFNGANTVFYSGYHAKAFITKTMTVTTGCDFRDSRLIMGGFDTTDFNTHMNWKTALAAYDDNAPAWFQALSDAPPAKNWVWWSTIGGGDAMNFFDSHYMTYGTYATTPDTGYTEDDPYWFDLMKRNEMGFAPMPWRGQIYGTKPMGDVVLVFGADGVTGLIPTSAPFSTFGLRDLSGFSTGVGVASGTVCRTAFAGDQRGYLFLDAGKELWFVSPRLDAMRVGYTEQMATLETNKIHIAHDPLYDEFFISDDETGYCLSSAKGLSKAPHRPTSIHFGGTGNNPIAIKFASTNSTTTEIITEKFSADADGMSIANLHKFRLVGLTAASNGWTTYVDYRMRTQDTWTRTSAMPPDWRGEVYCNVLGLEWRIVATAADRTKVTLEDIQVVITNGKGSQRPWVDASAPSAATE